MESFSKANKEQNKTNKEHLHDSGHKEEGVSSKRVTNRGLSYSQGIPRTSSGTSASHSASFSKTSTIKSMYTSATSSSVHSEELPLSDSTAKFQSDGERAVPPGVRGESSEDENDRRNPIFRVQKATRQQPDQASHSKASFSTKCRPISGKSVVSNMCNDTPTHPGSSSSSHHVQSNSLAKQKSAMSGTLRGTVSRQDHSSGNSNAVDNPPQLEEQSSSKPTAFKPPFATRLEQAKDRSKSRKTNKRRRDFRCHTAPAPSFRTITIPEREEDEEEEEERDNRGTSTHASHSKAFSGVSETSSADTGKNRRREQTPKRNPEVVQAISRERPNAANSRPTASTSSQTLSGPRTPPRQPHIVDAWAESPRMQRQFHLDKLIRQLQKRLEYRKRLPINKRIAAEQYIVAMNEAVYEHQMPKEDEFWVLYKLVRRQLD